MFEAFVISVYISMWIALVSTLSIFALEQWHDRCERLKYNKTQKFKEVKNIYGDKIKVEL